MTPRSQRSGRPPGGGDAPPQRPTVFMHLDRAIEAASVLGLDTSAAEAAAEAARGERSNAADATAAARAALAELGDAAGIHGPIRDLVSERLRRRAVDGSVSELAALLDMEGLERGALAVTRARAGRMVGGPIRALASVLETRATRDPGVAHPRDHLREWRGRGDLATVTDLLTGAVRTSMPGMPPAVRSAYEAAASAADLDARVALWLDRMLEREEPEAAEPPISPLSRLLAGLLWLDAGLIALVLSWLVGTALAGAPVPTYRLPLLGPQPAALVLLALALVAGVVLIAGLRRHVDRLGVRWARRMEVVVRIGARTVVEGQAFLTVDRVESARLRLANAVRSAEAEHAAELAAAEGNEARR